MSGPVVLGFKQCGKCEHWKAVENFYFDGGKAKRHRSSCKQCDAAYYEENRQRRKLWRETNSVKMYNDRQEAYKSNPEKYVKRAMLYARTANGRARRLYNSAKNRARLYGFEFDITLEQILSRIELGYCQRSGLRFSLDETAWKGLRNPFAPSLDRVDNDKGYVTDNVEIVCNMYNQGKGEANQIDFIAMCVAVAERHKDDARVIARLAELRNAV